jgi:hypothetical protein
MSLCVKGARDPLTVKQNGQGALLGPREGSTVLSWMMTK